MTHPNPDRFEVRDGGPILATWPDRYTALLFARRYLCEVRVDTVEILDTAARRGAWHHWRVHRDGAFEPVERRPGRKWWRRAA